MEGAPPNMAALPSMTAFPLTTKEQLAPLIVPYVLIVLASIVVLMRFAARRMRRLKLGWDDWLCLAAAIISWPYQIANTYAILNGVGVPMMMVLKTNPNDLDNLIKGVYASNMITIGTVTILQLSILAFYMRLFGVNTWLRYSAIGLMVACTMWFIACFITELFTCRPLSAFFNPPAPPGQCINQTAFCAGSGISHVILDLFIVALPMPLIWNLKISRQTKWILSGVLAVGLFTSLLALMKLTCVIHYDFLDLTDVTGSMWFTLLLQAMEIPLGVICTCIPTLSPVWIATKDSRVGSLARRLLSTISGTRSGGSGSDTGFTNSQNGTVFYNSDGMNRLDQSYKTQAGAAYSANTNSSREEYPLKDMPSENRDNSAIQIDHSFSVQR